MRKDYGVNIKRTGSADRHRSGGITIRYAWPFLLLAVAGGVALFLVRRPHTTTPAAHPPEDNEPIYVVQREPLTISVTESGTLKNREQEVVKCEVEGQSTILWIVPEGTNAHKGDLLVELDTSKLQDQRNQQQITVLNAEAAFVRARENLEVVRSQGTSDVVKVELEAKFALLDLEKYEAGEYPGEQAQARADINIAKEELQRAKDKLDWSRKLAEEGYITRTELSADELAAKRAQINLELAEGKAALLESYTHTRKLEELKSDIEQAERALERVKRKAASDLVQADADRKAKESEYTRQQTQLEKINKQIAKCRITAPVAGMVIYATTGMEGGRGGVEPLAAGQVVRERQDLIFLPTAAAMMSEVKVHEASLKQVRVGMPARVTVDALAGRVFPGRITKIALLPDSQFAWLNPDLKVFSTEVILEGDASELRAGMSCRVEMIAQELTNVVCVPVQTVLRVGGQPGVYVVDKTNTAFRALQIGADNHRMVHVLQGLEPGERILLSPPLSPSTTGTPTSATTAASSSPATNLRPTPLISSNKSAGLPAREEEPLKQKRPKKSPVP